MLNSGGIFVHRCVVYLHQRPHRRCVWCCYIKQKISMPACVAPILAIVWWSLLFELVNYWLEAPNSGWNWNDSAFFPILLLFWLLLLLSDNKHIITLLPSALLCFRGGQSKWLRVWARDDVAWFAIGQRQCFCFSWLFVPFASWNKINVDVSTNRHRPARLAGLSGYMCGV